MDTVGIIDRVFQPESGSTCPTRGSRSSGTWAVPGLRAGEWREPPICEIHRLHSVASGKTLGPPFHAGSSHLRDWTGVRVGSSTHRLTLRDSLGPSPLKVSPRRLAGGSDSTMPLSRTDQRIHSIRVSMSFLIPKGRNDCPPPRSEAVGAVVSDLFSWMRFHGMPLAEMTAGDVEGYMESKRAAGCKPRTIACICNRLRSFFRYMKLRGWVGTAIAHDIHGPRVLGLQLPHRGLHGETSGVCWNPRIRGLPTLRVQLPCCSCFRSTAYSWAKYPGLSWKTSTG